MLKDEKRAVTSGLISQTFAQFGWRSLPLIWKMWGLRNRQRDERPSKV